MAEYQSDQIANIEYIGNSFDIAAVSVVVVSYRSGKNIISCLDSLLSQSFTKFEIVVVDNGGNDASLKKMREYPITLVRMKQNVGCSIGKNIGAAVAQGQIVCFIDDDAIAAPDFVQAHYRSYNNEKISGVRGKVLPRDPENLYNQFAYHYNLGEDLIPATIDTETNASFRREIFRKCGGFNSPIIRGDGEGLELSYRLVKELGDPSTLIYNPDAVVYHDYAHKLSKFLKKAIVQPKAMAILITQYPDIEEYVKSYPFPYVVKNGQKKLFFRSKRFILRWVGASLRKIIRLWYIRK